MYPPERGWKITVIISSAINLTIAIGLVALASTRYGVWTSRLNTMIILANSVMFIYTLVLFCMIVRSNDKFTYMSFEIVAEIIALVGTLVGIVLGIVYTAGWSWSDIFNLDLVYIFGVCLGCPYFAILHSPVCILAYRRYKVGFWQATTSWLKK